jgi:hypothetical protein
MTKRNATAHLMGISSVACSLAFGALLVSRSIITNFPLGIDLPFNGWVVVWIAAFMLAVAAGFLGSKRWFLAALLPCVNFFGSLTLIFLSEPH